MGRIPIRRRFYFIFAGVCAFTSVGFGQAQAPSALLQIEAGKARTWSAGEASIVTLDGGVSIVTDGARLFAEQAVIWLTPVPGSNETQVAEIALIGNAKLQQSGGTRSGPRLMVNVPVRGTIRVTAGQRLAADASESDVYKQAASMRATALPLEDRPPRQLEAPDPLPQNAAPPPDRVTQLTPGEPTNPGATTRPAAPVNFQARDIETRIGPDGKLMVLLSGGVTLLQSRDNGDFVELLAQRAVLFTPITGIAELGQGDRIREVQQAVTAAYLEGDVQILFTPAGAGVGEKKAKQIADQRLEAERVFYEFATDRAVLTDAVIHTYDPQRGVPIVLRAQTARQLAVGEYSTDQVELTTSTFAVPSYSIRASKAYVRQYDTGDPRYGDRTVFKANNTTFNAFGIPVFYLPVVSGSVTDRGSPLRDIQFGGGSGFGAGVRTRWGLFETLGQTAPKGLDATYRLDYFADRGPAGGFDFDYTGGYVTRTTGDPWNFEGSFKSYIVLDSGEDRLGKDRARIDHDDEVRYRLVYEHQHFFPDDWQIQLRAGAVSDPTFMEEWFERDFDNGLPTNVSGYIKRQRKSEAITALIEFNPSDQITTAESLQETILSLDADGNPVRKPVEVERLPEIGYRRIGESFGGDRLTFYSDNLVSGLRFNRSQGTLEGDMGFSRRGELEDNGFFRRDARFVGIPSYAQTGAPGGTVYRGDFRQQIDYPLHGENFNLTPFVVGRYTAYSDAPESGSAHRLLLGAGARLATQFWKVDNDARSQLFDVNRIRHVIEPQAQVFTSISTEDREDVYIYDESIDAISDITAFQLALRQRWQTKRGGPGRERSVDFLVWNIEANFFANQPDEFASFTYAPANDRSGITAANFRGAYFYSHPEASLPRNSINSDVLWRISDTTIVLGDVQWNLDEQNLATTSLGLAARRDPRLSYFTGVRYIGEVNSTIASLAIDYQLTAKYSMSLAQAFDLSDNGRNSTNFTLRRRFDRFVVTANVFYDDLEDVSGISFGIYPEGLGYGASTADFQSAFEQR
ncbi:MAG TPA: LPS assembly protein LptD [Tepidisphaeraceae bacterium]|nr:LPS assembly protein LptD [Tepidisphaeraceae bacterium]